MLHNHLTALVSDSKIVDFVGFIIPAIVIIFAIWWCSSMYKTMGFVSKEKSVFPKFFIWLTLIPFIGFIFAWLVFPFGIPNGLRNALSENVDAVRDARVLKWIGLAYQSLVSIIAVIDFWGDNFVSNQIASLQMLSTLCFVILIAIFVLWIVYWVKVLRFRKQYFEKV